MKIVIEAEIHTEYPAYQEPHTAADLIDALSTWVRKVDFRWKIGDGEWISEESNRRA